MNTAADSQAISAAQMQSLFQRQRDASRMHPYPSLEERRKHLDTLIALLEDNEDAIAEAINTDFGNRPSQETRVLEMFGLLSGLRYTRKRLKKWAKPQKRHVGIAFAGAKNTVLPQPKGVVGVVTPWNYPLFLALSPATSALAAGNRCIIKMASNSQTLCRLMAKLVNEAFDDTVLAIVPGVSATDFTNLPWDHLVFTGSPNTGKTVMATAAQYLTPVTLELGGKSPTIVAKDYPVAKAAERLLFGKFLNAGQTCVAPDYVFVHKSQVDDFVSAAKDIVGKRYPTIDTQDFTAVIDAKAFKRLSDTLQEATEKGSKAIQLNGGEAFNEAQQKIAPHIVLEPIEESILMRDEIFGPLLPVKTYESLDEVIQYINSHERPLALYLYSNDKQTQQRMTYETLSGGMCINDSVLHVAQHDMPFGGIGNSGMGHYHGEEGFREFSKMRPIFKQGPMSSLLPMSPPYGKTFETIYGLMKKLKL